MFLFAFTAGGGTRAVSRPAVKTPAEVLNSRPLSLTLARSKTGIGAAQLEVTAFHPALVFLADR